MALLRLQKRVYHRAMSLPQESTPSLTLIDAIVGSGSSEAAAMADLNGQLATITGKPLSPVLVLATSGGTYTITLATEGGGALLIDQSETVTLNVVAIRGSGATLDDAVSDANSQLASCSGVPAHPTVTASEEGGTFTVYVVSAGGAGLLLIDDA